MSRLSLLTLAGLSLCLHAEEPADLLRFSNGDQLHGRFTGISEGPSLNWQREDLNDQVAFGIENLRHLVLRGGNPKQPLSSISLVELVNGDEIPGLLTAMDDKSVTIETSCAGTLSFERSKVRRIAPQPLGGRLYYHGPFSPERWEVVPIGAVDTENEEQDAETGWKHSGAAWYWENNKTAALLKLADILPERSTLRFDLAWKGNLNCHVVVHADFLTAKDKPDEAQAAAAGQDEDRNAAQPAVNLRAQRQFVGQDTDNLPDLYGNAFILQIRSNYMVIYRSIVDDKGQKSMKRIQTASNRMRLGENSRTSFELRSDLETGSFSLFADGEFITQWTDPGLKDDAIPPISGKSLAILPQIPDGRAKISDVIVAEWNGMPDSARSLQVDKQDIVLMTNGLDRLSGEALGMEDDGQMLFRGRHGEFRLPLQDIAELRFARDGLVESKESTGRSLTVRFSPLGHITGIPISGDSQSMVLRSPIAGDITIQHDSAVMFEFDDSNNIFTDWDANF